MDYWCHAIINNRLGEIYFHRKSGTPVIDGHCYIDKDTFTEVEVKTIQSDIPNNQFTYYRHKYHHL